MTFRQGIFSSRRLEDDPGLSRGYLARGAWFSSIFLVLWGSGNIAAFCQNTAFGEIRGVVSDQTSSIIPGVHVVVGNLDTGAEQTLVTNTHGVYDTGSTLPGKYRLTFSLDGFKTLIRSRIDLPAEAITVDIRLTLGEVSQRIVVNADSPLVRLDSSEQSSTLTFETMAALPQVGTNGQDWQTFVILLPGTAGAPSTPQGTVNPGTGVAINGTLPFYANVLADGASVTLPQSANFDSSTFETVSEVVVTTSTFSAQYGSGGAVFDQITKGGSNQWHGSAYEYFQNNALNARSYFDDPNAEVPKLRFDQFGGSVGGPILRKKMFFYFNFDKTVNNGTSTGVTTVPTAAERNGDFSAVLGGPALDANGAQQIDPCDGSVMLQNEIYDQSTLQMVGGQACRLAFAQNRITNIDPVANNLQSYYPAPNRPGLNNNYFYNIPAPNPYTRIFGRLDYTLTAADLLTVAVTERDNKANYANDLPCPINCQLDDVNDYAVQISEVRTIRPSLSNEFRFGFNRQGNYFVPDSLGLGIPAKVGLQYAKADILPDITISGGVGSCCDGLYASANYVAVGNSFEPSDVVTLITGKHIIHAGGEFLAYQENSTPYGNVQAGEFGFTGAYSQATNTAVGTGFGYADFLLGNVYSWSANNQPLSGARQKNIQAFLQDDVKLSRTVTLNAGLRYQIQTGWKEVLDREGTFDPTIFNTVSGTAGAIWFAGANDRNQLQRSVHDIVLPRLGFAWSPLSNTVIRGGLGRYAFGWSLDTYGTGIGFGSNSYGSVSDQSNGLTPVVSLSGSGSGLPYLTASRSATAYNGQSVSYNPYSTPVATMQQWSLSVQHQFGFKIMSEIAYVASHGEHLSFPRDINQIPADALGPNDDPIGRPFPQFESIQGDTFNASSNYNSLQISAERRLSGGWSFSANYTFAHLLDDMDSAGWGSRGGIQAYQNGFDTRANYGRSNFDIRHAAKFSGTYSLPFGTGRKFLNYNSWQDAAIGGWQVSIIGIAQSGNPFTVTYGGNNESYAQAGAWWPNRVGNPDLPHKSIYGWFNPEAYSAPTPGTFGNDGRNTLSGPPLTVLNASLSKTFELFSHTALQIRVDSTNVLNHPSFGPPDTNFDDPVDLISVPRRPSGGGTISTTTVGGRNVQLSARISF